MHGPHVDTNACSRHLTVPSPSVVSSCSGVGMYGHYFGGMRPRRAMSKVKRAKHTSRARHVGLLTP